MRLVNLGDKTSIVSFKEAVTKGLAPDGSLYYPESIPTFTPQEIERLSHLSEAEIAFAVLRKWLNDEIDDDALQAIVANASTFPTPVVPAGDRYVLEMFHGPTMAFKDFAARYLAAIIGYFQKDARSSSIVLVATSGDTGGAIAHGFGGQKNINVVVLFPKDQVSELQREQLVRVESNVVSLEVNGTFDDCQALVKQAFNDRQLRKTLSLLSANSISFGRLLPQIIYYFQAYAKLPRKDLRVVVPSGNLGNLTAALLAWRMGVPFQAFIAANNKNDSLVRYLKTGKYEPAKSVRTMSNAMDVGAPNNLPRLIKIFDNSVERARKILTGISVDDAATVKTIQEVYSKYDYLIEPHTAVGWTASNLLKDDFTDIIVATASAVKFSSEIERATNITISNEKELRELRQKSSRVQKMENSYASLVSILEQL